MMKRVAEKVALQTLLYLMRNYYNIRIIDRNGESLRKYWADTEDKYEAEEVVFEGNYGEWNIKNPNYGDKYNRAEVIGLFERDGYLNFVLDTKYE